MALPQIDALNRPRSSDQIMAGIRRRSLVLPALSVVFTLGLLALLLQFLPAPAAYGLVLALALGRIIFFSRGYSRATDDLRASLEATTERNAVLSHRERTNREVADEAIQSLYGAALRLDSCIDRLQHETELREDLDAAADSLTEVIGQIRRYVLELQPLPVAGEAPRISYDWPHELQTLEIGTGND